jgi:hypothetical protein
MPDIYAYTGDAGMRVNDEATWPEARDASTAEVINTTTDKLASAVQVSVNLAGNQYDNRRYFAAFDTSGITVKPESATLKLYGYLATDAEIVVIKVNAGATGGASADYVAGDYSQTSSTAYSSEYSDSWSTTAYNEITLNDDALNDMASLDELKIAVIDHDFDFQNSVPPNSTTRTTGFYLAPATGGDADKRPLISYVAGPEPTPQGTPSAQFGKDYTINSYNIDVLSTQYTRFADQVPFSLGTPGPARLRGRENAPIVSTGKKKN